MSILVFVVSGIFEEMSLVRILLYSFQFISLPVAGGDDEMGELSISSRTGLWSEERSFMFVIWVISGILTSAISITSGRCVGRVGVSEAKSHSHFV